MCVQSCTAFASQMAKKTRSKSVVTQPDTRQKLFFVPKQANFYVHFEAALKDRTPLAGSSSSPRGKAASDRTAALGRIPANLLPASLVKPSWWKWSDPDGKWGPCVSTVGDLVWVLVRVAFERLRAEYKTPYLEASKGGRAEAALLWIRHPLRWAERDVQDRDQESRSVCAIAAPSVHRCSSGYPTVTLGQDKDGKPVSIRLHYMLTHLIYGPPSSPDAECAVHQDNCHYAGHSGGFHTATILSPCCRSIGCLASEHLPGWSSRNKNSQSGSDVTVVARKRLRHLPRE